MIYLLNSGLVTTTNTLIDMCFNSGNFVPTFTILNEIGNPKVCEETNLSNIWEIKISEIDSYAEKINRNGLCILFLQDQLRASHSYYVDDWAQRVDMATELIQKITTRLVVIGLGVNAFGESVPEQIAQVIPTLPDSILKFVRSIGLHAVNIGVRGHITKQILKLLHIHNVSVIGCPSNFIRNPHNAIPPYPADPKCMLVGGSLLPLLAGGTCTVIHIKQDIFDKKTADITFEAPKTLAEWQHCTIGAECYRGERVHGTMVALSCGIPCINESADLRAYEMCELLKIPNPYHMLEFEERKTYLPHNDVYLELHTQFRTWCATYLND